MCKRWMLCIGMLLFILLAACSSEDEAITAEDIPDEPQKQEIKQTIENAANGNDEIDDVIADVFPLITTIDGDTNDSKVYATTRFTLSELSLLFSNQFQAEEISEVKDNQQIIIFNDTFVTLRKNEADQEVLLIEVADEEFVRRNYSPSFLGTYFSIRLLDSMFGNNWNRNSNGDYSGMGSYGGSGGIGRGNTTFRGGGPGTGK
ncbi:hypothetical protein [Oceanobacillus iheyensis HTE831]|uniref:DUF4247 domain-containing protein n=1 Tax=Oceanobacillus iheyensis (strain DSM 14371 / CIP 107618 / JCM 11309 / KCTC 3954 / HTE831) TaxID=221109 RepID=Q8CV16_OCEIH|nr:DUF4247 domain-containing protein [Oceanobacillus iheyensis]BAC12897.1 hypothetical protein [Oceanobacillus iheyensis HTE831]